MKNSLKNQQIQKQSLRLNQSLKLSIDILEMSIEKLEEFLIDKINSNIPLEIKFGTRYRSDFENDAVLNLSNEKNFFEELEEQVNLLKIDKRIKEICVFIINNLNSKGYLEISKLEIVSILKSNRSDVDKAFEVIYNLEPYGIGAYNLEECLKLQLLKKNIFDKKLYELIDKYLILIANKNYKLIMEKLEIDKTKLDFYIDEIKKLNPIPTRGYNTGKAKEIISELILKEKNQIFYCELNENIIPKISIKNEEEKQENAYKNAEMIMNAIKKRYDTLIKIANYIVEKQKNFLLRLEEDKSTLKITDIANDLSLSPSTVSRTIKDKYVRTKKGAISLKSLICLNSDKIIAMKIIEECINNENKEKPYSDEVIKKILNSEGVEIKRRTVTKYRKEMGYKSSSKRKI